MQGIPTATSLNTHHRDSLLVLNPGFPQPHLSCSLGENSPIFSKAARIKSGQGRLEFKAKACCHITGHHYIPALKDTYIHGQNSDAQSCTSTCIPAMKYSSTKKIKVILLHVRMYLGEVGASSSSLMVGLILGLKRDLIFLRVSNTDCLKIITSSFTAASLNARSELSVASDELSNSILASSVTFVRCSRAKSSACTGCLTS